MDDDPISFAVAKLSAIASVRPDVSPVVDAALDIAEIARAAVRKAELRARVAEETLADVTPEIKKIAVRAAAAEEEIRLRDQVDANERERHRAAKRETVAKAERVDLARAAAEMVETFAKAREAIIEKLVTAHQQCEPSLIEHRGAYGPFVIKFVDGSVFKVCETRKDALEAWTSCSRSSARARSETTSPTPKTASTRPGAAVRRSPARTRPPRRSCPVTADDWTARGCGSAA